MFWIIGYVLFVAYAAGLFTYSVTHDRPWAAVGILLSVSGFQLTVLETINSSVAIGGAVVGLLLVGRDLVTALQPKLSGALIASHRDHHAERAS